MTAVNRTMSMESVGALRITITPLVSYQSSRQDTTDHSTARHATDGTDEHDFAKQLRFGTTQPTMAQRQAMPSFDTLSTSTGCMEKPAAPMPVHMQTFDGHRSDIVNHPEDRPRAHHKRGSLQYEVSSDASYRNGPSAESGSSES
jgi:aquaporin related protein